MGLGLCRAGFWAGGTQPGAGERTGPGARGEHGDASQHRNRLRDTQGGCLEVQHQCKELCVCTFVLGTEGLRTSKRTVMHEFDSVASGTVFASSIAADAL